MSCDVGPGGLRKTSTPFGPRSASRLTPGIG